MTTPKKRLAAFSALDTSDVMILGGLIALIGGVAIYSKPAALIVFGLLLVFLGIGEARKPKATS